MRNVYKNMLLTIKYTIINRISILIHVMCNKTLSLSTTDVKIEPTDK